MRKCLVQFWIPAQREEYTTENGEKAFRNVAGKFSEWTPGLFHGWGVEGDEGATTSSAIVELEDGSVVFGYIGSTANRFKFVDQP